MHIRAGHIQVHRLSQVEIFGGSSTIHGTRNCCGDVLVVA